jgi:hypothetical protein
MNQFASSPTLPTKPSIQRHHTFHRRPYQKYIDVDLAPYLRQCDELNSIRKCALMNKHLSRDRLTVYHREWVEAGRPAKFIKNETRGKKRKFSEYVINHRISTIVSLILCSCMCLYVNNVGRI